MNIFGYISSFLLSFCALPQFVKIIKDGHCRDLSRSFLWMWFLGLVGMTVHTSLTIGLNAQLGLNFIINMIISGISLKYSYFPKKDNK